MLFCIMFALTLLSAATFGSPSPQNRNGGTVGQNGHCTEHHECKDAQHYCCYWVLYGQVCASKWFGKGCIEPPLSGGSDTHDGLLERGLKYTGAKSIIESVLDWL